MNLNLWGLLDRGRLFVCLGRVSYTVANLNLFQTFLCATGKEKFQDTELGKFLSDSSFRSEDAFSIHSDDAVDKERGTRIEQLLFLVVKDERGIYLDI